MPKILRLVLGLTIGVPLLLVGVSAAAIYGCFYLDDVSPIVKDKGFNKDDMIKETITRSFNNVSSRQALTIGLSEDDMNQLLLRASEEMNEVAKQFVGAPYVDIDPNKETFDIYLNLQVPLFKTRVKISTTIDFKRLGDDIDHKEGIMFKINEITIGRTGISDFILNIAKNFVTDQMIEQEFARSGFQIKCNLANKMLFYSAHDLLNDILAKSNLDPFLASMLDLTIEKGFLDVAYDKDLFGIDIKLNKLLSNVVCDDNRNLGYDDKILKYLDNVESLLNNNVILEEKVGVVLDYLCDGYNLTSDENKVYIDTLNLAIININDNKLHQGLNNKITTSITDDFVSQLPTPDTLLQTLQNQEFNVSFNEESLNKTLVSSSIIGKCVPFTFYGTSWHVNAIFIDDFYVNILDDALNLILGVNINGLQTKLVVPCQIAGQDQMKLKLDIKDIYYGQIKANQKMTSSCVSYVKDAISNLGTWFKAGEGNQIIFDLTNLIENVDNDLLKTKLSESTITSQIIGQEPEDNGSLNIKFKYNYSI